MTEQGIWTALFTVITGVLIYVLGQCTVELLIKPYLELRGSIGEICHMLHYRAPTLGNPQPGGPTSGDLEVADRLMNLASIYITRTVQLPCYSAFAFLRLVPSCKKAKEAYGCMTFLVGMLHQSDRLSMIGKIHQSHNTIESILGIAINPRE